MLTLVLLLDGVEVASQVVSVDELSAIPVTFKIDAPEEAGIYTVTIETLTGTFKVVVPPPEDEPAEPKIDSITPVPGEVARGALITIVVVLVNDRDLESLPRTLVLKVDGVVIEERTVTLGPRERSTETFTFSAPDVLGRHELEIAEFTIPFDVVRVLEAAVLNLIPPLTITPSEVSTGQQVTIKLTLRNSGEQDGQTEVILTIRGQEVERKIALVPGLKDVTVTFQFVPQETGDYPVEVLAVEARDVRVLEGSFKAVAPPVEEEEPPSPAKLVVVPGTLKVEPEKMNSGEPVTISLNVTNEGGVAGTRSVVLFVNDVEIDRKTVTLGPGKTGPCVFKPHVERGAGTFMVRVDDLTSEFTVTKPVSLALTIPLLVIFALVVIGLAVLMYFRATRGAPPRQAT